MVEVEFQSIKKIVVHEVIEHTVKELVKLRTTGMPMEIRISPFRWTEGVLFSVSSMPPTDLIIKDQLEGIIHFAAVEWAVMPRYKKSLRLEGIKISVKDVSSNHTLRKFAIELKKTHKKN